MSGHVFERPDDILLDTYYAAQQHTPSRAAQITLINRDWHVAGIVEPGKLPIFRADHGAAGPDRRTGKVSQIYVKLDDPSAISTRVYRSS